MDDSHVVYGSVMRATVVRDAGREWYSVGFRATPLGIVGLYTQPDFVRLTFVYRGRQYERHIAETLSERGLATVAGRFARDVATGRTERDG